MSIRISLLEQAIPAVSAEIAGGLKKSTGAIALYTRVVIGIQAPNSVPQIAKGYRLAGNESLGSITLESEEAVRLSIAFMAAMICQQPGTIIDCSTVADYIKGYRQSPHHIAAAPFPARRQGHTDRPPDMQNFTPGTTYDFAHCHPELDDPRVQHVVLGTDDPTRNFSKLGSGGPLTTMRNIDTAVHYRALPLEVVDCHYVAR